MANNFNFEPSLKSSGTVAPCRFVSLDPNFDEQYIQSTTGHLPIGVMNEAMIDTPGLVGSDSAIAARSGDTGPRVIGLGNDCLIECGGTVSNGTLLKPDSVGRAVSASSNDNYGAVALNAGTTGVKIRCIVRPGKA